MDDCAYFASDANKWEQVSMATWGSHNICPLLTQFQVMEITWLGLSAISHVEAWGDPKKPKSDNGIPPLGARSGCRGGEKIWASGSMDPTLPSSSPSLDKAARKLALLINTG